MAQNTGFQQAIYAGKFTTKGSEPLDKDGNFCSVSGQKQAILLLEGHANPDPSKYEVVGSFKEGDVLDGYPSMIYNTDACPLPKPEATLPEYEKHPAKSIYIETVAQYQILGNNWDSEWNFSKGLPNKGTYPIVRIGEYEWMTKNLRMNYVPGRIWDKWITTQHWLDAYQVGSYDLMTVDDSLEYEGGFFGGSMNGNEVDAIFKGSKFYTDVNKVIELTGWKQPSVLDFAQLFTMADKPNLEGIIDFLVVEKGNDKYPFQADFVKEGNNKSGFSAIPAGTRANGGLDGTFFGYVNPRRSFAFKTNHDEGSVIRIESASSSFPFSIIHDNYLNINNQYANASIKYFLMSVRYCRPLSDIELGYKMYIDEANDKIIVTKATISAPVDLKELPKGRLRGRAVRWLNPSKTEVLVPLSTLKEEVTRTDTGGADGWFGFD